MAFDRGDIPVGIISNSRVDEAIPFLKWAGGKRWLINYLPSIFPSKYQTYYEPFLGSGAVFFYLKPERAFLSDVNTHLIETYNAIKYDWSLVIKHLRSHQNKHSHEYYYYIRSTERRTPASRAARFIYLNRTCFNGLYRVNKQGEFNVPIGTRSSVILPNDDFAVVSKLLRDVTLAAVDFENAIDRSDRNDLVFIDPPYTVSHNQNGFIKYNERLFTWEDQLRLQRSVLRAHQRGVKIVMTNADHPTVKKLYSSDFKVREIKRNSSISGGTSSRKVITELLISN
jgi:DNA adenine methylase